MTKDERDAAKLFARTFAVGFLENAEPCISTEAEALNDAQRAAVEAEVARIAKNLNRRYFGISTKAAPKDHQ
jgi:hypothetical protein